MKIQGITPDVKNINRVYNKLQSSISENNKYTYRLHSLRPWDLNQCINAMQLKSTDVVLEFGAWNTYGAIDVSKRVKLLYTTDNFAWSEREYAMGFDAMSDDGTCSPIRWVEEFTKYKNIIAESAELEGLHYNSNMFDKVYSISVVEHIPDDLTAINEVHRVLKPGGIFTFTCEFHPTRSREFSSETGYYRVYTPESLLSLISDSDFDLQSELRDMLNDSKACVVDAAFTTLSITLKK